MLPGLTSFNVQCNLLNKNTIFITSFFFRLIKKMARPKSDNCCRQKTAKTRLKGSYSNYEESQENLKLKKALSLVQCRQLKEKLQKLLKFQNQLSWITGDNIKKVIKILIVFLKQDLVGWSLWLCFYWALLSLATWGRHELRQSCCKINYLWYSCQRCSARRETSTNSCDIAHHKNYERILFKTFISEEKKCRICWLWLH